MAKILIVDDDKDILKFTDALLSQAEHDVKIATDPVIAIELLSNRTFDLVITDANMPHYTGFELVKTIRSDARHKHIGIAMLTGMREKESIEKAVKAGVDDYIVKPIDPVVFLKKVSDLLEKKPPKKQQEIQFSDISHVARAKILLDSQVISMSESHIKIKSSFAIPEGSLINLVTNIFEAIEIKTPPFKVISLEKEESDFLLTLSFIGLTEKDYEKIRSWIHIELNKRKQKAS